MNGQEEVFCPPRARCANSFCLRSAASSLSFIARSSSCSFAFSCASFRTLLARFWTFCVLCEGRYQSRYPRAIHPNDVVEDCRTRKRADETRPGKGKPKKGESANALTRVLDRGRYSRIRCSPRSSSDPTLPVANRGQGAEVEAAAHYPRHSGGSLGQAPAHDL